MEYIRKSIYRLPEIRRSMEPLWWAWGLTGIGLVCGLLYFMFPNMSSGASGWVLFGLATGACCLLLTLCYYAFGDSRRPYSKELHARLEPEYTYYPLEQRAAVEAALAEHDEAALEAARRNAPPQLALVRYSDPQGRVFYSQLTRMEGRHFVPLTEIITFKIN